MCSEKFLKTVKECVSCNVPDFFYSENTQREIGYSKGTLKAIGHSSTWALEALDVLYLAISLMTVLLYI